MTARYSHKQLENFRTISNCVMDDLVERLRQVEVSYIPHAETVTEAADRLESLQARIEALEKEVAEVKRSRTAVEAEWHHDCTVANAERDALVKERNRLREALNAIAEYKMENFAEIARAALVEPSPVSQEDREGK